MVCCLARGGAPRQYSCVSDGSGEDAVEGVGNVAHSSPPGWYPAGDASGTLRWWDGRQWTNHVAGPIPETPPRRSRTRSALLISLSVLAAVAVMFGSMLLYAFASGEAHDARSLDDEDIRSTASASCSKLAGELTNRTRDRVADIRSGNVAIDALVDTMNELDREVLSDDEPALDWIGDWQQLAASREAFASQLEEGIDAQLVIPTVDGYPITERMTDVSPQECAEAIQAAASP
jgi:hypothetical protein